MVKMRELIWIACMVLVADAAFHRCEISFLDEPLQGHNQGPKGEKGEPTKTCNCSALADELAQTKQELSDLKRKPRDCYDVIYYNRNATSGVYRIFPSNYRPEGIEVLCDMDTDGGGWVVFQTRKDGSVDFYRGWKEYVLGFGDFDREFWLGLEYIHQLTKYGTYDLRIDMTDFEKHDAYAVYSSFSIGEAPGYVLNIGDFFGDAGDSLGIQRNHKFTTLDKDQDSWSSNCAVEYTGAWWYASCHSSNLNGQYMGGATKVHAKGITWKAWKGQYYSLKSTEMKIRPNFASYV